jgi:hypothetical protein
VRSFRLLQARRGQTTSVTGIEQFRLTRCRFVRNIKTAKF